MSTPPLDEPRAADAPIPAPIGEIVGGRYRVERVLGRGGMGVVVAATHLQLEQTVAIKFPLAKALLRRDLVARVIREGRAAARLRGEHVARVIDVGTLDSGEPFLVLEYLHGKDIGAILRARGPLPLPIATAYVLDACEGLAEAHRAGIVHRDLKPSNLFLTRRPDGSECVKIIDFGVAKDARPPDERGHAVHTTTGAVFGTPVYMSPEQMRSSRDVDARTDVWSLGAVFFTLLCGSPPFPPMSLPEMYHRAAEGPPPVQTYREGLPPDIDHVFARALAADLSARFSDVATFAEALVPFGDSNAREQAARVKRILEMAPASEVPSTSPAPAELGSTLPQAPEESGAPAHSMVETAAAFVDPIVTEEPVPPSWSDQKTADEASGSPHPTSDNSPTQPPATVDRVGDQNRVDEPIRIHESKPATRVPSKWLILAAVVLFGAFLFGVFRMVRSNHSELSAAPSSSAPSAPPRASVQSHSLPIPASTAQETAPTLSASALSTASSPRPKPKLPTAPPSGNVTATPSAARPDPFADPN